MNHIRELPSLSGLSSRIVIYLRKGFTLHFSDGYHGSSNFRQKVFVSEPI